MRIARTFPRPTCANLTGKSARLGVAVFLVALSLGCGSAAEPTSAPVAPGAPVTPVATDTAGLLRVEVTTVTTGVHLDPDGYGVLNDEWDYGDGDGNTVAAPTNGTVILYLRPGAHVLSLIGVAENCSGENLDDRSIQLLSGVATVAFQVVCRET